MAERGVDLPEGRRPAWIQSRCMVATRRRASAHTYTPIFTNFLWSNPRLDRVRCEGCVRDGYVKNETHLLLLLRVAELKLAGEAVDVDAGVDVGHVHLRQRLEAQERVAQLVHVDLHRVCRTSIHKTNSRYVGSAVYRPWMTVRGDSPCLPSLQ